MFNSPTSNPILDTKHIYDLREVLIVVKTELGMQGVESYTAGMSEPKLSGNRNDGKRFKTVGTALRTLERLSYKYPTIWVEGYRVEGTKGEYSLVTYVFNSIAQRWEFSSSFPTGLKTL